MSSYEDIKEEDVINWIRNRKENLVVENRELKEKLDGVESWHDRCMDREELIFKNITTLIENRSMDKSFGKLSDGYHTFNQLYDQRALLLALALNNHDELDGWKSLKHDNPDFPMFKDMFIVGGTLPTIAHGDFTFHIDIKWWNYFKIKELPMAKKYDGHSVEDVMYRISAYLL